MYKVDCDLELECITFSLKILDCLWSRDFSLVLGVFVIALNQPNHSPLTGLLASPQSTILIDPDFCFFIVGLSV